MDGQRFDAWTRGLSHGFPRRGALKTLVGMALAGAITRTVSRDTEANCSEEGDDCGMGCCEGLVCKDGSCEADGEPGGGQNQNNCGNNDNRDCAPDNGQNNCGNNNEPESVLEQGTVEGDGCKKKKHDKKHNRKHRKKGKHRR